ILHAAVVTYRRSMRRYLSGFLRRTHADTVRGVLVPGVGHILASRKWRRKEQWKVPAGQSRRTPARLRADQLELLEAGLGGPERGPLSPARLRAEIQTLRRILAATSERSRAA